MFDERRLERFREGYASAIRWPLLAAHRLLHGSPTGDSALAERGCFAAVAFVFESASESTFFPKEGVTRCFGPARRSVDLRCVRSCFRLDGQRARGVAFGLVWSLGLRSRKEVIRLIASHNAGRDARRRKFEPELGEES